MFYLKCFAKKIHFTRKFCLLVIIAKLRRYLATIYENMLVDGDPSLRNVDVLLLSVTNSRCINTHILYSGLLAPSKDHLNDYRAGMYTAKILPMQIFVCN